VAQVDRKIIADSISVARLEKTMDKHILTPQVPTRNFLLPMNDSVIAYLS